MIRKVIVFSILIFLSAFCKAQKTKKIKGIGSPQKTLNPDTPYIYKKGYLNFDIVPTPVVQNNDTISLNLLKFNAVFSAMYTQKVMYDKFGKWTKELRPNNERHPILVWSKVKLFENKNELFTIYANGDESWEEIYASVLVFDENGKDCLSENNTNKSEIIRFFSEGIKILNNSEKFYKVYLDAIDSYKVNPKLKRLNP
ncbi:hypothetical protein [Chryseobacterium sp. Leaf394]|uniref:hypothetical protein n=1 Tax=Chryseobacterium sp. Leaf394 TaxID=1736361 RepID=UPI0006FBAA61|nr:hypothetical protein [Chryseobacterium sp. Leaf394]KQS90235.1 hypothetical protein ASG21_14870 [Chryseobacterium sp. Leaf394]